jgi:hypothetical protein
MRLTSGPLNPAAVTVVDDSDPPRVQIRFGQLRLTLSEAEAVNLATQLVDAVAQLRTLNGTRK